MPQIPRTATPFEDAPEYASSTGDVLKKLAQFIFGGGPEQVTTLAQPMSVFGPSKLTQARRIIEDIVPKRDILEEMMRRRMPEIPPHPFPGETRQLDVWGKATPNQYGDMRGFITKSGHPAALGDSMIHPDAVQELLRYTHGIKVPSERLPYGMEDALSDGVLTRADLGVRPGPFRVMMGDRPLIGGEKRNVSYEFPWKVTDEQIEKMVRLVPRMSPSELSIIPELTPSNELYNTLIRSKTGPGRVWFSQIDKPHKIPEEVGNLLDMYAKQLQELTRTPAGKRALGK